MIGPPRDERAVPGRPDPTRRTCGSGCDFAHGPDVNFIDQRTFGGLSFSPGGAELPAEIAHIARDPLDPVFDLDRTVATSAASTPA